MLMFDRKIKKPCRFVWVTTSEFVLSVQKSIDSCKFKVVPEGGQQNWTKSGQGILPNTNNNNNLICSAQVPFKYAHMRITII
jgi:hypothetical protein